MSSGQQDDLEDFEMTEKTSGGVEVPEDDTFNLFREIVGGEVCKPHYGRI